MCTQAGCSETLKPGNLKTQVSEEWQWRGGYRYRAELWGMKSFSRPSLGCGQPPVELQEVFSPRSSFLGAEGTIGRRGLPLRRAVQCRELCRNSEASG